MTIPTPRAALERLLARLDETTDKDGPVPAWMDSYCTAVQSLKAEPELEGPSLNDVDELCAEFGFHLDGDQGDGFEILRDMITAAIARWRAPVVEPFTPPASEQGDAWWHELISEIARVQHVAQGEGQGPRFDLAKAVKLSRRPTPPAPEPGEAKELHPLWYLVEFLEGHSSFRRRTEPTDELAEILSNSATLLQQQATELAARTLTAVEICHSHTDGECHWEQCPQLRDGEPATTGRSCPLPLDPADIERAELDALRMTLEARQLKAAGAAVRAPRDVDAAILRLLDQAQFMQPGAQDRWEIENAATLLQQQQHLLKLACQELDNFMEQQATELAALREVPVAGISDEHRDAVREAVAEALGNAYDCQRVWSAWNVGTMGQDDFTLTAEDDDRVAEIADAATEAFRTVQVPAPQAGEAQP